jgi:hypothetical protein
MIYKLNYAEAVLEFVKNRGRAFIEADSAAAAIDKTRELFEYVRDPVAEEVGDRQYLVNFRVALDYRPALLRQIEKSLRLLRDMRLYQGARSIDRYLVACIFRETGVPGYLVDLENLREEISAQRKASVVAREVANILRFVEWDICIQNYIEINFKEGHRSRVFRTVKR